MTRYHFGETRRQFWQCLNNNLIYFIFWSTFDLWIMTSNNIWLLLRDNILATSPQMFPYFITFIHFSKDFFCLLSSYFVIILYARFYIFSPCTVSTLVTFLYSIAFFDTFCKIAPLLDTFISSLLLQLPVFLPLFPSIPILIIFRLVSTFSKLITMTQLFDILINCYDIW